MTGEIKHLSREELFGMAWANPASQVAADLGIDERALRSICSRHSIPCPSDAYWARVNTGEHFAMPPLRAVKDPALEQIEIIATLAKKEIPRSKSAVRNVEAQPISTEVRTELPAKATPSLAGECDSPNFSMG